MSTPLDRRAFLGHAGTALGAAALAAACSGPSRDAGTGGGGAAATPPAPAPGGGAPRADRAGAISVQLYTLRELVERDMPGTLGTLAEIGYPNVEFAGYYGRPAAGVRRLLDEAGLRAPSADVPLADLRGSLGATLDAAATVGHQYVICPYAEGRTTADWQRLAADFNRFGEAARERGLQFGYHNHDFEFAPLEGGAGTAYDVLLAEADRGLVQMELDLYWAVKANQDPVALFERQPGRFPLVHVKDMRDVRGARRVKVADFEAAKPYIADVGAGEIDFAPIFANAEAAGLRYYVVEHDAPADPIASVRASYGALRRLLD
jgi:sugar phosphate isomerase/epimerase